MIPHGLPRVLPRHINSQHVGEVGKQDADRHRAFFTDFVLDERFYLAKNITNEAWSSGVSEDFLRILLILSFNSRHQSFAYIHHLADVYIGQARASQAWEERHNLNLSQLLPEGSVHLAEEGKHRISFVVGQAPCCGKSFFNFSRWQSPFDEMAIASPRGKAVKPKHSIIKRPCHAHSPFCEHVLHCAKGVEYPRKKQNNKKARW